MKSLTNFLAGTLVGFINALFGAGGGMVCVPILKKQGKTQKEAQACTVGTILPLCVISAAVYWLKGYYNPVEAAKYIPFSLLGGLAGALLLKKIPDRILRKVFGLFMLYLGVRMILR